MIMKNKDSSEEVNRHLRNMRLHLKQKQPDLLLEDIRAFNKHKTSSDVHDDAYEKYDRLEPRMIQFLFKHLPLEQFMAIHEEELFHPLEIYEALDAISESISIDQLFSLVERLEFPSENFAENLFRKLVEDPHESTTRKLEEWIQRGCAREAEEGRSFSQHQKTMSSFRYVRWMPDDQGLSEAVSVLAQRRDPLARKLTADYLLTLPWGPDRRATSVLIGTLFEEKSERNRKLIKQALDQYTAPGELRLMLLRQYEEYGVQAALKKSVQDLSRVQSDDERFSYLNSLWSTLEESEERGVAVDIEDLGRTMESLRTDNWSFLSRGHLGVILSKKFHNTSPAKVSNVFERWAIDLILAFERMRLDHMGCLISIPVLFGAGYLFLFLLNFLINKPAPALSFVDDIALILWIVTAALTSRTHFSGNESISQKFWMALIFWVTPLCFLSVSVAIRV